MVWDWHFDSLDVFNCYTFFYVSPSISNLKNNTVALTPALAFREDTLARTKFIDYKLPHISTVNLAYQILIISSLLSKKLLSGLYV
jgi:hypothetical protein